MQQVCREGYKSMYFLLCIQFVLFVTAKDVGILYEVWHTTAAAAMAKVKDLGGLQLTTEKVIQSNGGFTLNDVYGKYGINADIYNVQPQLGFYWYERR